MGWIQSKLTVSTKFPLLAAEPPHVIPHGRLSPRSSILWQSVGYSQRESQQGPILLLEILVWIQPLHDSFINCIKLLFVDSPPLNKLWDMYIHRYTVMWSQNVKP